MGAKAAIWASVAIRPHSIECHCSLQQTEGVRRYTTFEQCSLQNQTETQAMPSGCVKLDPPSSTGNSQHTIQHTCHMQHFAKNNCGLCGEFSCRYRSSITIFDWCYMLSTNHRRNCAQQQNSNGCQKKQSDGPATNVLLLGPAQRLSC
jgi:hypothetical protein